MVFCSEDHGVSPVAQHGDDVPVAQFVQVPLYLAVSCLVFGVRLWSTRLRIFLGLRKYLRIQHSLVRPWIHVGVILRGFCKNFTRFIRGGGRSCSSRAGVEKTAELPQLLH